MTLAGTDKIVDFAKQEAVTPWHAIDDRIMGGNSQSHAEHIEGTGMRFSGIVSLENNGGFASIRSGTFELDLSDCQELVLRLRGDGKNYKISLRNDDFFDGVSYQATFATRQQTWQEIALPFDAFTPTHHGILLTTVAPLDTTRIRSIGLFIADRQVGPFQLDLAWIKGI